MKKLNKFTACFLAMSFSLTSAAVYAADAKEAPMSESYIEETMSVQSGMWQTTSSRGSVSISDDEKDVVLNTTASSKYNASAEATTAIAVLPSDNDVTLKFSLTAEGFATSKQTGTVSVKNANSASAEIISISDSVMKIMGSSEQTVNVTEGETVNVEVMFNTYTGNALIKINDSVFTFYENTAIKELHTENNTLNVVFRNASVKVNTSANLSISGFNASQTGRFVFDKVSANGVEIGTYCKESVLADGIKIGFRGTVAEEIYDASNYTLMINSSPVQINIAKTDGGIILTPEVPFVSGESLTLSIPEIKDAYGVSYANANTITFAVLGDDFEVPAIDIECNDTELYIGQSALIDVSLSGSSWDWAEIYANGVYEDKVERDSFTYSFSPETAGEYILKFVVLDNTYQMSDYKEITVNFVAIEAPEINLGRCSDGDTLNLFEGNEGMLSVSVSDDLGIEKTEIYVNGEISVTIPDASYEFDLSTLSLGSTALTIKTYDIYGRVAEASVYVLKSKEITTGIFSEKDFAEEGSYFTSGIQITRQRGFVTTGSIDEEYGNSMLMGMDENCDTTNFNSNQYTFIQHSINSKHVNQKYEFDVNVLQRPHKNAAGMTFAIRYSDGVIPQLFSVSQTGFVSGSQTLPYNENEWYHVAIMITKSYFNVTVTDANGNSTKLENNALDETKTMSMYRFFTTASPENLFTAAVDNIKVSAMAQSVIMTAVGDSEQKYPDKVPAGLESFRIYTEGDVIADDINIDNVFLYGGTVKKNIKKLRYSANEGFIEIYPEEPLDKNSEYTVILSGNIRFGEAETLGEDLSYTFRTESDSITVNSTEWEIVRDNIKLTVNASNSEVEDKTIYVFMSEFDNSGKYTKTTVFEKTLFGDTISQDIECTLIDAASSNIEMFISDDTNIGSIYHTDVYEQ